MSRAPVSSAVLSVAVVAILAAPVAGAETCYGTGPCLICCADDLGGGCLYSIRDDWCICGCERPGGSSEPRYFPYRESCYINQYD